MEIRAQKKNHWPMIKGDILRMIATFLLGIYCIIAARRNLQMALPYFFFSGIGFCLMLFIVYALGYAFKSYYITDKRIIVSWFRRKTLIYKWSDFRDVRKCVVHLSGVISSKNYEVILCSKIPLQLYYGGAHQGNYVEASWITKHSKDVLEILIADMTPEQYEEFWAYVPNRFKPSV